MIRAVLVDDEPPARARLRALLEEMGGVRVVAEAGDAEEARAAIAGRRPDVVFLDIEMPETPGTARREPARAAAVHRLRHGVRPVRARVAGARRGRRARGGALS